MEHTHHTPILVPSAVINPPISPLMLADRMLHLAQEADRAGFPSAACCLLGLIDQVLDRPPC